jgi:hypothetical protein
VLELVLELELELELALEQIQIRRNLPSRLPLVRSLPSLPSLLSLLSLPALVPQAVRLVLVASLVLGQH